MQKDELFAKTPLKRFVFDEAVAGVFDDMLKRSVPFYSEVQKLIIATIMRAFEKKHITVVDLGCSTATFLISLAKAYDGDTTLIGVDNSQAMIERATNKADAFGETITFVCEDVAECEIPKCDVIVLNYTLQFIEPQKRAALLRRCYEALRGGGLLFLREKVVFEDEQRQAFFGEIYYDFKRAQGYSEIEIARKKEALEDVLIPLSKEQNITLLKEAGFDEMETIFAWVNFATFYAKK